GERGQRLGVAGLRGPDDLLQLDLDLGRGRVGPAQHRADAGHRLQAPAPPAAADGPFRVELDVAQLAAEAEAPPAQPPVEDDARADPHLPGQVDQVGGARPAAEALLGQGREVGVVVHLDGEAGVAQRLGQVAADVGVAPAEVGREAYGALHVDQAGHGDGQAEDLPLLLGHAVDHAAHDGGDVGHGLVDRVARAEGAPPGQQPLARQVGGDGRDVVDVDLDPDGGVRGAVEDEHGGGPADAVLGEARLTHQAAVD